MPKRTAVGVVTSDKMQKTRRVEIPRLMQHRVYGKIIRRRTICYVHDENNQSAIGDSVEIVEARPMSKTKRWELVRIVQKFGDVDAAAMQAASETADPGASPALETTPAETTPGE
jgi:small subunit ribosomal protein S17